ncbi:type III-B CRISPR module RAMP protein Cmr6 [Phocaeicola barnesiae]|uniref:type III-B CRISPR module RAMP protein Cmr6 n=1 Tax=Phocaeicola barnesiae TaxID=376804 RepID=UPI00242A38CF|nr:type III-B CRISPR module RAMP protein Cmr6 [Phocaeicola barnesiae]
MEGNIGWKYNKAYFYNLQGNPSNGNLLKRQNDELLGATFDESYLEQLLNVWDKSNNIFRLEMTTSYPGLITGIGNNHQTTLKWMDQTREKPVQIPEFKLGITFDHTTGVPIIPGSSIKGVLRSFFPVMNQNKFCDCYEEKINYIAAILHKVHLLVSHLKNEEAEKQELRKDLLISRSGMYTAKTKDELLSQFKEEYLEKIYNMSGISNDELDVMTSDQALAIAAEKQLEKYELEEVETIYKSYNRDKKKKLEKDINDSYGEKISMILNRPLEDEEIDNEDKTKASCLALEMFEGKKKNGEYIPIYQRDTFFDAIPVSGDSNADGELFAKDFITSHKNPFKDPEPICFMKIRSNVKFRFYFSLHDGDKDGVNVSKEEKLMLIKYLLYKNGIGAKTNVGYGQFKFSKDEMLKITQ